MPRYERACAAVIRDNAILMVYFDHGEHKHWSLPGGGIEPGESPAEAALRELREEAGIEGCNPTLLYERPWGRPGEDAREYCFLVDVPPDQQPATGQDPEATRQDLAAIAWRPLVDLGDDVQISRVVAALRTRG